MPLNPKSIIYFLISLQIHACLSCKGCVNLDESSFHKILPKFEVMLTKFDVAFPYGDKHEIFSKLATETANHNDLLLAEVGVKDYGDKDNEELARKFGVSKEDFPAIKLFVKGSETPVSFPADLEFNLENLREFIRDNSDIYLGLPGCLEMFDKIAAKFIKNDNKQQILEEATKKAGNLNANDKEFAKTYMIVMKKIIENGVSFVAKEKERVQKLLKGKINAKKQSELTSKLNILRAFAVLDKDEL